MKKFLPYILILVVLVGVFSPNYALAQWYNPFPSWMSDPATLLNDLLTNIAYAILVFLSWFAGFAGAILDYVLTFTIVNMKVNVFGDPANGIAGMTGINTAWKIIKDLMNIAFIFILLYESIKIIIGQGSVESVKRFVLGIVLASLLINFSLFFTKILIDASNIVTIGVYRSILSTPVTPPQPGQPPQVNSIATILLSKLKLQSVYNVASPSFSTLGASVIFLVGSSIVFLISTFVIIAITANFVIRYITLIILLVLSPLAYMGIALNAVKPYQKKWWDSLKGQLIFAPVFMILLMIVITLISNPGFVSQSNFGDLFTQTNINPNGSSYNTTTGGGGANSPAGLVLNFTVIIGLLIATLTVSKSTAKSGADQIGSATSKLTGYAGGMFMGGAGRLGRNTIGRAGSAMANSEYLKNRAVNGGIITRNMAKFAINRADSTANSSFDIRSTGTFGSLAKSTGADFGKGADSKKVNYNKILDEKAKKEAEFAKKLKPTDDAVDKLKAKTQVPLNEAVEVALKNTQKAKEERDELNKTKERLEKEKERADQFGAKEESDRLNSEIISNQNQIKAKEEEIKTLEKLSADSTKAAKDNEEAIKNLYSTRAAKYADLFSKENSFMTWSKNVLKSGAMGSGVVKGAGIMGLGTSVGLAGTAAIGATGLVLADQLRTPSENRVIARRILKDTKAKSEDEQLAELVRKKIEREEKEKKEKEGDADNKDESSNKEGDNK